MARVDRSYGFTAISTVSVALVVAIIAIAGLYVWKHQDKQLVSKGSASSQQKNDSKTKPKAVDPYADWQNYSNQMYGITLKYPPYWTIQELSNPKPGGANPSEYTILLKLNVESKYNSAVDIDILTSTLKQATNFYDDYYAQLAQSQIEKKSLTLKGRQAVQYDVMAGPQKIKLYLLGIGEKTYSFGSINEELNEQTSSVYWSDFDRVFDSLNIK